MLKESVIMDLQWRDQRFLPCLTQKMNTHTKKSREDPNWFARTGAENEMIRKIVGRSVDQCKHQTFVIIGIDLRLIGWDRSGGTSSRWTKKQTKVLFIFVFQSSPKWWNFIKWKQQNTVSLIFAKKTKLCNFLNCLSNRQCLKKLYI